ncbi:MAG TPA: SAM-dependent chlorinase/fluorinase [Aggregatilineales bacterium]|nr:SAM-dependent chlorinase/fluorinase [Aggregatilineales bacterium]
MTIALLTDFGLTDAYVGVMKGVMLGLHPRAALVDITHGVQPQNVRQAALTLMTAYRYFPAGTVFLVVVDPGVGSTRRPVAVQAGDYGFVAPDNGVLSYTLAQLEAVRAVELETPAGVSSTFHGRDIFAPAAARLARGDALGALGSPVGDLVQLPAPRLSVAPGTIRGEVVHIDHFGNVVTSIGRLERSTPQTLTLRPAFGGNVTPLTVDVVSAQISAGGVQVRGIHATYSEVEPGTLLALVGSSGLLELGVNQGNAAARLGVRIGDTVEVTVDVTNGEG